jgi:adenine-specific DNA-methyltransferase
MTREVLEERRLVVQRALDDQRTRAERNRLGQFATPPPLAGSMVASTLKLLSERTRIRFLDPALGTGSFYSALIGLVADARLESALGFEIDREFALAAARLWRPSGLELRIADFTLAPAPSDLASRPNLLICNPPYVRHHHLDREAKTRLQMAVKHRLGIEVSGLSGLYCYFMLMSHAWMADDGVAAWLVPSEFMDVGYGQAIKHYLLGQVETLRIHRFDPADVQFDDALVSSCVVWFRKRQPMPGHTVAFSYGGSIEAPATERLVSADELRLERKWTRFPTRAPRPASACARLGDFFVIRRGMATGANGAFIMTIEQARERGLPAECLRPILPSPRHLAADEVLADKDGAPCTEPQVVLLDCRLPEHQDRTSVV